MEGLFHRNTKIDYCCTFYENNHGNTELVCERQCYREREEREQRSRLTGSLPSDCNGRGRLKAGAGSFTQDSYVSARTQSFGPPFTAFPDHYYGAGLEVEQLGIKLLFIWDTGVIDSGLTDCATA